MNLTSDLLWILLIGYLGSRLALRLGLPGLTGMVVAGLALGSSGADVLSSEVYALSTDIRLLALLIILLKAGLGLDKEKLLARGSVALRLVILPVLFEASVIAIATRLFLGWEWLYCWLLGWIVCAASPAVIVPLMLKLKSEGWGVDKGIPDLILAEATISDATAITMFGITLAWLTQTTTATANPVSAIAMQVFGGLLVGFVVGKAVHYLVQRTSFTSTPMQDTIVALAMGLLILVGRDYLPYSEYLAIMMMGSTVLEADAVVARRLREGSTNLWVLAEIFLFVLIGASVDISQLSQLGGIAVVIVLLGVLVGKGLGIVASTVGSDLLLRERLFMAVGGSAKATVQAAIAGLPLALGLPFGEEILAISVAAILFTAPVGAFATTYLAPRLLVRGEVDPTRVTVEQDFHILVAVDDSSAARQALKRAATTARDTDAFLTILHVASPTDLVDRYRSIVDREHFLHAYRSLVSDLAHEVLVRKGTAAEIIVEVAERLQVDYIYMGKANRRGLERILVGDTAHEVISHSETPVILVDEGNGCIAEAKK